MRCFHCTEQVEEPGRWQAGFDGATAELCCAGCQAVMQAIVDAGLGDYYRFRTEPARFGVIPEDLAASLDALAVFDEPEIRERYLLPVDKDSSGKAAEQVDLNLALEGLRCGACVWVLERSIAAIPGVDKATVNFSSARASIRFDASRLKLSDILRRVSEMGYQGVPFDARERELSLKRESRVFLQRLFVAGIAMMQVMMYALPAYLSDAGDIDPAHEQLLRWASLVLTTPVMLYSAQPFLKGAWQDLRRRQPGMDVPVSISILAAFTASVWATVTGSGEIYFDTVAMFVFLLLAARYLEWSVRRRAMRAVDDIGAAAPETAQRFIDADASDSHVEIIPAMRLEVDDIILVDNGERVPVDALVQSGRSALDNSLVTGESTPVAIGPGDVVAGGALLTGAPVRLRVLRRQNASTLSVIDRLIERGASEKPRTVLLADRLAAIFVSVLLVFAALVWGIWMLLDPARAAPTAIAVLVVSCPCALSLATPAALAAATGDLLRSRLLITRGHALETLARVTDVVFDKTGTLTTGAPSVSTVQTGQDRPRLQVLELAVAMELGSTHPYAVALRRALDDALNVAVQDAHEEPGHHASCLPGAIEDATQDATQGAPQGAPQGDAIVALQQLGCAVTEMEHSAGHGVRACMPGDGVTQAALYLGSADWCGVVDAQCALWQAGDDKLARAASEVYLVQRLLHPAAEADSFEPGVPEILARFLITDRLRPEVASLIASLKHRGLRVHLLSGDRPAAVEAVAESLRIEDYSAAMTPDRKQDYVVALQSQGAIVMMVGDGINDAPVLASADVSLAAGEATALARTAADVISLLPGLEGLTRLLDKAGQTMKVVKQNLRWAAMYNLTAIPLASLGLISPWLAAVGMAGSSLLVALNAQRLWSRDASFTADAPSQRRLRLWNRFSF